MKQIRQQIGGLGNLMFKQAYLVGQWLDKKIPDIYLQSDEYWKEHKEYIRSMYSDFIEPSDFISLHIRRGDYNNNLFYVNLTQTDYYDKAIAMFPNEKFLIFCSDRQSEKIDRTDKMWCFNWATSKGINFILHNGTTEAEDMNRMAGCKGHIMANSSFSWWAAFIGGGKVVAPSKWFSDGVERTKLLEEWIKI